MEEKTYTVIELAESAGAARTTINDWLSKYSAYIDYKMVGRRRVYTEAAAVVVKEIAELRNKGFSAPEIESELAKKHPVRPEIADTVPERSAAPETSLAVEKTPDANPDEFALIAKQQSEELGRFFAESFRDMADRMQSLEGKANRAERKLYFGYACVFILLAALCVCAFLLFQGILKQSVQSLSNEAKTVENGTAIRSLDGKTDRNGEAIRSLDEKTVRLSGSAAELRKGIAELKTGLADQKKEFRRAVSEMKNAKDAEIALLKENFAGEKKKLLSELDRLEKEKKELRQQNEKWKTEAQKPAPKKTEPEKPDVSGKGK